MKKIYLASPRIIDVREANKFGFLPAIIGSFGDSAYIYEIDCESLEKKVASYFRKIAIGWQHGKDIEYVTENVHDIVNTDKSRIKWFDDVAIPDKEFLINLLKASPEVLKNYIDEGDFARAISAIEVTRRLLNFISNVLENPDLPQSEEYGIDEVDLQETAERIASYFGKLELSLQALKENLSGISFKVASASHDLQQIYQTVVSKYKYLQPVIDEVYSVIKASVENPLENYYFANSLVPFVRIAKLNSVDNLLLTINSRTLSEELFKKIGEFLVEAFIKKVPNAKNSKGESAPWCVFSHKTKKRLSCYKTKEEAKKALQRMHIFKKKSYVVYHKSGEIKGIYLDPISVGVALEKEATINKFMSYLGRYIATTEEYSPEEIRTLLDRFVESKSELAVDPADVQFKRASEIMDKISKYLDARKLNYKISTSILSSKESIAEDLEHLPENAIEGGEGKDYVVHELIKESVGSNTSLDNDSLKFLSSISKEIMIPNGVFVHVSFLNEDGEPVYDVGINDGIVIRRR